MGDVSSSNFSWSALGPSWLVKYKFTSIQHSQLVPHRFLYPLNLNSFLNQLTLYGVFKVLGTWYDGPYLPTEDYNEGMTCGQITFGLSGEKHEFKRECITKN